MTCATSSSLSLILAAAAAEDDDETDVATARTKNSKPREEEDDDHSVDLFHDCSDVPAVVLPRTSPSKKTGRSSTSSVHSGSTVTSTTSSRNHMSLSNLSSSSLLGIGGFLNKTKTKLETAPRTKNKVRINNTTMAKLSNSDSCLNGGHPLIVVGGNMSSMRSETHAKSSKGTKKNSHQADQEVAPPKSPKTKYNSSPHSSPKSRHTPYSSSEAMATMSKLPKIPPSPSTHSKATAKIPNNSHSSTGHNPLSSATPRHASDPSQMHTSSLLLPPRPVPTQPTFDVSSSSAQNHNNNDNEQPLAKQQAIKVTTGTVDAKHNNILEQSVSNHDSFLSEVMAYAEEHHAMQFSWVQEDVSEPLNLTDVVAVEQAPACNNWSSSPETDLKNENAKQCSSSVAPKAMQPPSPPDKAFTRDSVKKVSDENAASDAKSSPQQETLTAVVGTIMAPPLALESQAERPLLEFITTMKATAGVTDFSDKPATKATARSVQPVATATISSGVKSPEKRPLRVLENHAITSSPAAQRFALKVEAAREKLQHATEEAREKMASDKANHQRHHNGYHHRQQNDGHQKVTDAAYLREAKQQKHRELDESERVKTTATRIHSVAPENTTMNEAKLEPKNDAFDDSERIRSASYKNHGAVQSSSPLDAVKSEPQKSGLVHQNSQADENHLIEPAKTLVKVDTKRLMSSLRDDASVDIALQIAVGSSALTASEVVPEKELSSGVYKNLAPLAPGELAGQAVVGDSATAPGKLEREGAEGMGTTREDTIKSAFQPINQPLEKAVLGEGSGSAGSTPLDTLVIDHPARPMTPIFPSGPWGGMEMKPILSPAGDSPRKVKSTLRKRDGTAVAAFEMAIQAISESTIAGDGAQGHSRNSSKVGDRRDRNRKESISKPSIETRKLRTRGTQLSRTYSVDSTAGKTGVRKVPAMITTTTMDDEISSTDMTKPVANGDRYFNEKAAVTDTSAARTGSPQRPPGKIADSTSMTTSNTRSTISSSFSAELAAATVAAAASEVPEGRRKSLPPLRGDGDKTPPRRASYSAPRRSSNAERRSSQSQLRRRSMTDESASEKSDPSVYKMVENYFPMSPVVKRTSLVVQSGGRRRSSVKSQAMNLRGSHTVVVGGKFMKK